MSEIGSDFRALVAFRTTDGRRRVLDHVAAHLRPPAALEVRYHSRARRR